MKHFNFLFVMLLFGAVYGQTLPIDFETSYEWTGFDGGEVIAVSNPEMNGNGSAMVGKMTKYAGQPWGGAFLTLAEPIDFENNNRFSMKVLSPRAGVPVLLKVENSANPGQNFEQSSTVTTAGVWETVEFDYSLIPSGTYDRIVLIFDLGTMGDGSENFTFHVDDITLFFQPSESQPVTLPITFEDAAVEYNFGDFGNAFGTKVANPDVSGINTSANVGQYVKAAGAESWAGTFLTLAEPIDFSAGTMFTMKIWSPKICTVMLKVENIANGGIAMEIPVTNTLTNQWEELSFDFSGIDMGQQYQKVVVFFDFGQSGDDTTYYFDDITLGSLGVNDIQDANSRVKIYPNPAKSSDLVKINTEVNKILIFNSSGKLLNTIHKNEFAIQNLQKGMYFLQIHLQNGSVQNQKLLVK